MSQSGDCLSSFNKPLLWAFQQSKHAFVLHSLPSTIALPLVSSNVLFVKRFIFLPLLAKWFQQYCGRDRI